VEEKLARSWPSVDRLLRYSMNHWRCKTHSKVIGHSLLPCRLYKLGSWFIRQLLHNYKHQRRNRTLSMVSAQVSWRNKYVYGTSLHAKLKEIKQNSVLPVFYESPFGVLSTCKIHKFDRQRSPTFYPTSLAFYRNEKSSHSRDHFTLNDLGGNIFLHVRNIGKANPESSARDWLQD